MLDLRTIQEIMFFFLKLLKINAAILSDDSNVLRSINFEKVLKNLVIYTEIVKITKKIKD